ncbi:hypothetical protein M093_1225 [Bacteroides uniformis str. 3978 T3 i]|uniref:Uncharacterized protein n=1 Tax=Bacteroides uniformis str. 3978 T3 ii TaxID=1339349 RepID=A0A078S2E6_BACUN|nr:hypothetical protein M094_1012 [Bacteroides uniformis str. 3978 T3 ii]KDS60654.1 hypothetical protein M093_1225 [Bacteroides uniformis str. 3978 T3 i]
MCNFILYIRQLFYKASVRFLSVSGKQDIRLSRSFNHISRFFSLYLLLD